MRQIGIVGRACVAQKRHQWHVDTVGYLDALFLEFDDLRAGKTQELLLELLPDVHHGIAQRSAQMVRAKRPGKQAATQFVVFA